MVKVDWSIAPKRADFYAKGRFWQDGGMYALAYNDLSGGFCNFGDKMDAVLACDDYEKRQQQWPESDERVDIIGTNGGDGMHYDEFREEEEAPALKPRPTYSRDIIGLDGTKTTVDVYRVLDAFKTESAAIDHAVKKLLCAGIRHQKDRKQDLEEAIKSIQAELLLMSQR